MKIINKFRAKSDVTFKTTHGHTIQVNKNSFAVEIDCNVKIFFNTTKKYYEFMQNPNYYQTEEVKLINIIKDPEAVLDTVDDQYYEGERVYSVIILHGIIFIMFDEG